MISPCLFFCSLIYRSYRLMWFCCITIGAIATMVIIMSLWEKFQTNPTITGLDTDFHNWDVAFPAITVCQSRPSNDTYIDDFIAKSVAIWCCKKVHGSSQRYRSRGRAGTRIWSTNCNLGISEEYIFFCFSKKIDPEKSDQVKEFLEKLTQLSYATLVDFKLYTNKGYIPDNVDLKELAFQVNIYSD